MALPTHGEVAQRAYHIWEREGRPHGRDFEHWLMAERELSGRPSRQPERATAETATTSRPRRTTSRSRKTQ